MKKSLLLIAFLLIGFFGFGQNKMPYIIQYQMQGDTIYHNLQSVEMIHIDSTGQEFVHGNGSDLIPLSGLDTVYIFRDEFRRYTGQMADWDEVLFSTEQIYFYKGNEETGLPKYLFNVIITDSIPNGYFVFTEFDDEGYPEYMNFNDSCFMVIDSVYGEYYDAVVIAKDMSSFTMDSVRMEEAPSSIKERYQSLICSGKALTPGSGQYAVEVSNQYLGSLHMAVGGTIVVFVGCSMLVPGVNIAVGATIALAGAAEFTSGALLAAHATDQIISDGSHTQGFEGASKVFGFLSNLTGGPIHALLDFLIEEGLTQGIHYSLYNYFEIEAAKQRAQRIRNLKLTTGRATLLDLNSHSVQLWGYVREKMQSNDYFGIFISDKRDALEVMNCMLSESNNPGAFTCDFDALEPLKDYYYRAYYYATEFANLDTVNPWIVSKIKAFKMPGVITLEHEHGNSSNSYWLHGKFQDVANQPTHTVGFCYSYTNEEPTYDDEIMEQTVYDNGEFSGHLFMNSSYDVCYYRAYAFINGEIAYGEVKQISGLQILEFNQISAKCRNNSPVVCVDLVSFNTIVHASVDSSEGIEGWGVYYITNYNGNYYYRYYPSANVMSNDSWIEIDFDIYKDNFDELNYTEFYAIKSVNLGVYYIKDCIYYYGSPMTYNLIYNKRPSIQFLNPQIVDTYQVFSHSYGPSYIWPAYDFTRMEVSADIKVEGYLFIDGEVQYHYKYGETDEKIYTFEKCRGYFTNFNIGGDGYFDGSYSGSFGYNDSGQGVCLCCGIPGGHSGTNNLFPEIGYLTFTVNGITMESNHFIISAGNISVGN